ncbi:MAG: hypothetical protein QOI47_2231 [Actinomycetota bacterium]|jgi:hypothetical protein|nr:hypothetical protein [Actinomycetota bacterium]
MVPVRKVSDQFEAKVIAARLGASGFVTQLRGGGIEGPYPMGQIEVLVEEEELGAATELLLADDVESSFDDGGDRPSASAPWRSWSAVLVVAVLALTVLVRVLSLAR